MTHSAAPNNCPQSRSQPWPRSVLFVCNQNSVRSPMAYGLADSHAKRRVFVDSAGLENRDLDPFVAQVMREWGYDLMGHHSKTIDDVTPSDFDLVVALTDQSYNAMLDVLKDADTALEFWPTADPCLAEGNRQQVMDAFRLVRDDLDKRIKSRLVFA